MKKLFTIGEVAKLKGTTVKALRFYDKIGLVRPAYIDPETKYRYYELEQLLLIEQILMFKSTGASLREIADACSGDNSAVLADFCFSQIVNAKKKIADLSDMIDRYTLLISRIYHDKARSVNPDVYVRTIGAREVYSRDCETPPTDENTYEIYFDAYSSIRHNQLSTIYATGSIVELDRSTGEFAYRKMYVEVSRTEDSSEFPLSQLPAGDYLCVNYFERNRKQQIEKIIGEINRRKLTPALIIEADTFLGVTQYVDPMMELQVLL